MAGRLSVGREIRKKLRLLRSVFYARGRMRVKIHLIAGGTKRYRDSRTGREYRFDWERFCDAAFDAGEREDSIEKVRARLAEAAHIAEAVVGSHLRNRGASGASFPADISIIRSYGAALTGDEDAFLRPAAPAERLSPAAAEKLKRWGEQELAVLDSDLDGVGYGADERQVILVVFALLWEILSLYGISDGYNRDPFRP